MSPTTTPTITIVFYNCALCSHSLLGSTTSIFCFSPEYEPFCFCGVSCYAKWKVTTSNNYPTTIDHKCWQCGCSVPTPAADQQYIAMIAPLTRKFVLFCGLECAQKSQIGYHPPTTSASSTQQQ